MTDLGTMLDAHTVRFERLLPGPIERVWEHLTTPGCLAAWLAAATIEPRVGGRIALRFDVAEAPERRDAGDLIVGVVTRWDPPRLLAYTWNARSEVEARIDGAAAPEVVFELSERGVHVLLVLTHRELPAAATPKFCAGWHTHLAVLAARLAGTPPEPFLPAFRSVLPEYERRAVPAGSTARAE